MTCSGQTNRYQTQAAGRLTANLRVQQLLFAAEPWTVDDRCFRDEIDAPRTSGWEGVLAGPASQMARVRGHPSLPDGLFLPTLLRSDVVYRGCGHEDTSRGLQST